MGRDAGVRGNLLLQSTVSIFILRSWRGGAGGRLTSILVLATLGAFGSAVGALGKGPCTKPRLGMGFDMDADPVVKAVTGRKSLAVDSSILRSSRSGGGNGRRQAAVETARSLREAAYPSVPATSPPALAPVLSPSRPFSSHPVAPPPMYPPTHSAASPDTRSGSYSPPSPSVALHDESVPPTTLSLWWPDHPASPAARPPGRAPSQPFQPSQLRPRPPSQPFQPSQIRPRPPSPPTPSAPWPSPFLPPTSLSPRPSPPFPSPSRVPRPPPSPRTSPPPPRPTSPPPGPRPPPSPRPPPPPRPPLRSPPTPLPTPDRDRRSEQSGSGSLLAEPPTQPQLPPLNPSPPPASSPPPAPELDPLQYGRYELAGRGIVVAIHLMVIPGTDRFLLMERPSGYHSDGSKNIAGFFDLPTRTYTHLGAPDAVFCSGHTFLDTGDLLIVGGHVPSTYYPDGMKSIRTFNRSCEDRSLRKVRDTMFRRWYPSATLLPDGKVLIMGGTQGVGAGSATNAFWELYDPITAGIQAYAMRTLYLESAQQVYYPFNFVLPEGFLFTFCGRDGFVLDWRINSWFQAVPHLRGYASTEYPYTGTAALLGLYPERNYQVEIVLFGGQKEAANKDISIVASPWANRLKLSWNDTAGKYTFTEWLPERMSVGRVMPDCVLLPNGKLVILNGANTGLAGDSASGGRPKANFPVFYAELYDPDLPEGQRFRPLARTQIARMYHSTAVLATDGTVLVAGCDRCAKLDIRPGDAWDPSKTRMAEYRIEIFSPPYVFRTWEKPSITSLRTDTMAYDAPFSLSYTIPTDAGPPAGPPSGQRSITRAVLVAPGSTTHSFNTNQRLVGLEILEDAPQTGELTVRGPPNINIAPPGMYMLFLLNGDVYSKAVWVKLTRPMPGAPGYMP